MDCQSQLTLHEATNPLLTTLKRIIERPCAFLMIIPTKAMYSTRVLISKVIV